MRFDADGSMFVDEEVLLATLRAKCLADPTHRWRARRLAALDAAGESCDEGA